MQGMRAKTKRLPLQFSLRSLLAGLTWFAMILAICVQYQHTATRQRQALDAMRAIHAPLGGNSVRAVSTLGANSSAATRQAAAAHPQP